MLRTHYEAHKEADFGHFRHGQLAGGFEQRLLVLACGVGHARELGLECLIGRQLPDLHDVAEAHAALLRGLGCREKTGSWLTN